MIEFLSGAVATLYFLIAICFLKFWNQKRDRLFLMFALAFALLGLNQIGSTMINASDERSGYIYVLRVLGYILILFAIADKNRASLRH